MGYLDKLRAARDAASQAMRDAQAMNAAAAASEPWLDDKSLRGPAGRWVYGLHLSKAEREAQLQPRQYSPDPVLQARAELAERARAREPYLAPERTPLRYTRIPTRESSQVADVARFLAGSGLAARPDLVYGVYRVPDHIGGGLARDRYTEWEVLHADVAAAAPAPPPDAVWFDAGERWVARRLHEPMVHDEELALAYLTSSGLGPERTFGISRLLRTHQAATSDDNSGMTASYVTGVLAWRPAGGDGGALERLRAAAPIQLEEPSGIRLEVFNWAGIRRAVQPSTAHPPLCPSPFPYLPATPQELIASYLDVVGVHPSDCYAASVTEDVPKDLNAVSHAAGFTVTHNVGAELPCADGKPRRRLHGGSRLVLAYRDRASYAVGRERFAAYEAEVLQSQLAKGAERRPLEFDDLADHLPRGLRGLVKGAAAVGRFATFDPYDVLEKLPPFRYCWPPVGH